MKTFILLSLLLIGCSSDQTQNTSDISAIGNPMSKLDTSNFDKGHMTTEFIDTSNYSSKCSIYGDKPVRKFQILDSLKNRNHAVLVNSTLKLTDVLTFKGDDTKQYNSSNYVQFTGYIILVKYGGAETCNCHSTDKNDLDIHIELALTPDATATSAMVLEVNRYTRHSNKAMSDINNFKKLVGKKVTVEGFMFLDDEHLQNAMTTNPTGGNNWRYTCWELHPLLNIKQVQ